jgi:hypothetical protein
MGAAVVAVVIAAIAFAVSRRSPAGAKRHSTGSAGAAASGARVVPPWFGVPAAGDRRIAGIVFLAGVPTPATLTLASAATDAGAASVLGATAGADGRFELGTHRAGMYRLFATAPGAVPRAVTVDCERGDAEVEVFLDPCRTTVVGDVRDASGGPIGGATISTAGFTLATTDDDGRYQLCLGTGSTTLVARADGYAAAGREVETAGSVELDFDLVPEAIVTVHVVDPQDQPVTAAMVRAVPAIEALDDGAQPAIGITDAAGTYELRGLAPSTYELTAAAPGLTTDEPVRYDPAIGATGAVTIQLVAAVAIPGRIVEAGKPVPGIRIRWQVDDADRGHAISAADGTFTIVDVPAGPGELALDEPIMLIAPREHVAAAGSKPVDVEIQRPHVVRGRVVRAGAPVGGAHVRFLQGPGSAVTRADGSFTLPFRAPGQVRIEATSDSFGAFGTATVKLEAGLDVDGVEIDLVWGGTISGVIVDQAGAPLPGVAIAYNCAELNDVGRGVTGPDGRFVADKLRGGCTYAPSARLEGGPLSPATDPWPEIALAENGTLAGVRLVARVERTTIAGIVVDDAGTGIADVLIQAEPGARETRTAVDGRFTLRSTQPGPFRVEARSSGQRTARADRVPAGTRDLRLVLVAPGAIHVTCTTGAASRLRIASMIRGQQRSARCGATIGPLAPERYIVLGDDIATMVDVEAGEIAEVAVAPVGRSDVEVTLTGASPDGVVCAGWWFYADGEANIEKPVDAVDGVARLRLRRGKTRIVCRSPTARGDVRFDLGDEPAAVTVKLVER